MTQPKVESANWRDYYELCKPNVVLLMLLTSVIGMFMSVPGMVPWEPLVYGNLGIALCAGAAAAVNHLVDSRIDLVMARTHNRPIAQGRVKTRDAAIFAAVIGGLGMAILLIKVNALTAWLTLASLLGYAVVYTLYLKRATPQNIVIGGIAGAAPPLLGIDHFHLDATTFLGFGNSSQRRLCKGRDSDVAGYPWHWLYKIAYFALHHFIVCGDVITLCNWHERHSVFIGRRVSWRRVYLLGDCFNAGQ